MVTLFKVTQKWNFKPSLQKCLQYELGSGEHHVYLNQTINLVTFKMTQTKYIRKRWKK